jgi:hypothetical protein
MTQRPRPRGVLTHLTNAGILPPKGTIPARVYADGTAVHEWTAALDTGSTLPALPSQRATYLCECYLDWRQTHDHAWEEVEELIMSWRLDYCGVVDRIGPGVCDIKTGKPAPWHALQSAAYAVLVEPEHYLEVERSVLYLSTDKPARLVRHSKATDFTTWLDALRRSHDTRTEESEGAAEAQASE